MAKPSKPLSILQCDWLAALELLIEKHFYALFDLDRAKSASDDSTQPEGEIRYRRTFEPNRRHTNCGRILHPVPEKPAKDRKEPKIWELIKMIELHMKLSERAPETKPSPKTMEFLGTREFWDMIDQLRERHDPSSNTQGATASETAATKGPDHDRPCHDHPASAPVE